MNNTYGVNLLWGSSSSSIDRRPQYLTTHFKDISSLLSIVDISEVIIMQDCEEAYALLGSMLLQNQSREYLLIKDMVKSCILYKYLLITDSNHVIETERDIRLTDDKFTFHLRDK